MPAANSGSTFTPVGRPADRATGSLIEGFKWGGALGTSATVSYSFPTQNTVDYWSTNSRTGYGATSAGGEPWAAGFRGLNTPEQAAVTGSLQSWSSVANIGFTLVTPETTAQVGDIRLAWTNASGMDSSTYAYTYVTKSGDPIHGDVWLNSTRGSPLEGVGWLPGQLGHNTLLHELGHAIGLDHPFSPSNPLAPKSGLTKEQVTLKYSVMAYADAPGHWDDGTNSIYPTTPMLLDIKALQFLYGANMSYHAGNDTYTFDGTGNYYQTIWDAGGVDTIAYNSASGGLIDLRAGNFSRLGNPVHLGNGTDQRDTVAIAYNVTIENATGGSGNDTLIGNAADNVLDGAAGADTMAGGAGNDTYFVDNAADIVQEALSQGTDSVTSMVSYVLPENVENLNLAGTAATNGTGNAGGNVITGNGAANVLRGAAGNDTLTGGEGDDILYGGAGNDQLSGGAGADVFVMDTPLSATLNRDLILDFLRGEDRIWLDDDIFTRFVASSGVTPLASANFRIGAPQDLNDFIVYAPATGNLSYDADGSGRGRSVLIAVLGTIDHPTLTEADFAVIA